MKNLAACFALLAALALNTAIAQAPSPQKHSVTYSLLPGKTLNLSNKYAHEVEIRTEYPVQLAAGPCHSDYTVQWHCTFKDEPSDLFIRDLRNPPVFQTPRANTVTITFSEN
jgi:hypothetical protein